MSPAEAGRILLKMVEKYEIEGGSKEGLIEDVLDWPVIVLSDLGMVDFRVCSTDLKGVSDVKGGRIHCLILPSSMDDLEQSSFDGMHIGD
jgi:diphthamide biosynthesis methyltransferase